MANASTEMERKAPETQDALFELDSWKEAKLTSVDVAKIDIDDEASFDRTELHEFSDNIRRTGLIEKPTLKKVGSRYVPIVGRRRCAALKLLATLDGAWQHVEMFVRTDDVSDADIAKMVLSENARRSANVLAELDSINVLVKQKKMTAKGVARSIGQNVAWVRKRLSLNQLDTKLKKLMEKGRLRAETAYGIAKLDAKSQQRVLTIYERKKKENPNAILAGADVSEAKSKKTVALPDALFKELPPTEAVDVTPATRLKAIVAEVMSMNIGDDTAFMSAQAGLKELTKAIERLEKLLEA